MDTLAAITGLVGIALASAATGQSSVELKNWFDDPYFAVSHAVAACPVPRGPLLTKEAMEHEAHVRVERGTRCYQEGKCRLPNSYRYDPDIALHVRTALERSSLLARTSLWVTVQRRWIFIQGCVDASTKKAALEKIARRIPDVENVFVDVTTDPARAPPYNALPGPSTAK